MLHRVLAPALLLAVSLTAPATAQLGGFGCKAGPKPCKGDADSSTVKAYFAGVCKSKYVQPVCLSVYLPVRPPACLQPPQPPPPLPRRPPHRHRHTGTAAAAAAADAAVPSLLT